MKETIETAYAQMQKYAKRFAASLDASDFVQKISEDAYMAGELFIASKIFDDKSKKSSTKEIDWEQRRYEIAKELYCNYLQRDVTDVVRCADALNKELKKKRDEAI